ncbi:Peroxidase 12 [Asimina triloba]
MARLTVLLLLLVLCLFCEFSQAQSDPPLVKGLSWTFYGSKCAKLENIVQDQLRKVFKKDIGLAAALLRVHFHDCFVQGCDGSVLLDGSASGPGEQDAPPNLTLRKQAFTVLNDLRERVEKRCGRLVSCTDILALAARDAVFLSGGPEYRVPLGRRDSLNFATRQATLDNLPPPTSTASQLIDALGKKNLDPTDLVALSGGHTIGIGHCSSFTGRLYPNQDPTMDKTFANNLKKQCPTSESTNTTVLDLRTPNAFDNKYYVDLMNRQGLFTSDQDLYTDKRTRPIVTSFAINQTLFFQKFVLAMVKMGQLNVLTGTQGEIRGNCSVRNSAAADAGAFLSSVVLDGGEEESSSTAHVKCYIDDLVIRVNGQQKHKDDLRIVFLCLRNSSSE